MSARSSQRFDEDWLRNYSTRTRFSASAQIVNTTKPESIPWAQKPDRFPQFTILLRLVGLPDPVREFEFHSFRNWRYDYAWPDQRVVLDVEGGIWSQGREKAAHAMPLGILRDMEKANAATLLGFRVLRYTPQQLMSRATDDLRILLADDGAHR